MTYIYLVCLCAIGKERRNEYRMLHLPRGGPCARPFQVFSMREQQARTTNMQFHHEGLFDVCA